MSLPKKITLKWCQENSYQGKMEDANEDSFQMPFGKYKGEQMADVPVSYLNWLWTNGMHKKKDKVANYIRSNLVNLKKEDKRLIW